MTLPLRTLALGLALALTLAACDSGGDTPGGDPVTVTGTLENSFDRPVDGATLTFTSGSSAGRSASSMPTFTTTTSAGGVFSVGMPVGTYSLTVTHPNYPPMTVTVTISGNGTVTINTPPLTGSGGLQTTIINALTGQGIPNSTIGCSHQRADGSYPAPPAFDFTATSNADGRVTVGGTPYGPMQCTATTALGTFTFAVNIGMTGTTTAPPVTAVPLPSAGEYRVVVTWGTAPRDLDSHLTGPDGSGGRFHVFYGNRTFNETGLDLDDTSGEGPETTTISAVPPAGNGMYRFSVHNYSDQSANGAQGIAESPTFVNVFSPQGLVRRYQAPPTTLGNTWRVFEMNVQNTAVNFNDNCSAPVGPYPANTPDSQIPVCRGLGYFPATGPSDTGTFLTGGPGPTPTPKEITL